MRELSEAKPRQKLWLNNREAVSGVEEETLHVESRRRQRNLFVGGLKCMFLGK